jgi:DUF4097 and DUF4098 domain-containing protein YvlB
MRYTTLVVLLVCILAMLTHVSDNISARGTAPPEPIATAPTGSEREEINQTVELSRGANVRVQGINGFVEISTTDSNAAEIHIVRTARSRAELEFHKVLIETQSGSLVVRGERDNEGRNKRWGNGPDVRQEVTLKLPRFVSLDVSGVNGRVTVGELDGSVNVSGINGPVEVARAGSSANISGVNGSVTMLLSRISEEGLTVSGVNGRVMLSFSDDLDANLDVNGVNGSIDLDVPRVTVQGKISPQRMKATIGAGGPPITVSGVNGSVRLVRAGV